MPDLAAVNALDPDAFVALLGGVFEHAPWVAEGALPSRPFSSIDDLHAAMIAVVRNATEVQRLGFLNGHPELAGPEARAGRMTADSASEQDSAGLDAMSPEDAEAFDRMNPAYRKKFGYPFIIAVRGRSRAEILSVFAARLAQDQAEEDEAVLSEISAITRMRLARLVQAGGT